MTKDERKVMWKRVKAKQVYRLSCEGYTAKEIQLSTGVSPTAQSNMYLLGERLHSIA